MACGYVFASGDVLNDAVTAFALKSTGVSACIVFIRQNHCTGTQSVLLTYYEAGAKIKVVSYN